MERGPIGGTKAHAIVANLPPSIAKREVKLIGRLLSLSEDSLTVEEACDVQGPGNVVSVEIETGPVVRAIATILPLLFGNGLSQCDVSTDILIAQASAPRRQASRLSRGINVP
jgi:hypothetical protein